MPITDIETGYGPSASGESTARVPGIPAFVSNGALVISFNFSDSGNGETVTFAIYVESDGAGRGYLKADGTDNGASEVWQTKVAWTETITAINLIDFTPYRFKVKAKSELGTETAFSDYSAIMNTLPSIDYGPQSANLEREVTGGNTVIDEIAGLIISGNQLGETEYTQNVIPEYWGAVRFTYLLKSNTSATSRIIPYFSEDSGENWAVATDNGTGDGLTGLNTSLEGVSHVFDWDSYTDSGKSELKTTVIVKIEPYDSSPTGGDASDAVESTIFGINNRPAIMTWGNDDGYEYDKDSTPIFIAVMSSLRGGIVAFPELTIYGSDGTTEVQSNKSVESTEGWEYETEPDTWVAVTIAGIPYAYINGVNRVRYTVQSALPPAAYIVKGRMGEIRNI